MWKTRLGLGIRVRSAAQGVISVSAQGSHEDTTGHALLGHITKEGAHPTCLLPAEPEEFPVMPWAWRAGHPEPEPV